MDKALKLPFAVLTSRRHYDHQTTVMNVLKIRHLNNERIIAELQKEIQDIKYTAMGLRALEAEKQLLEHKLLETQQELAAVKTQLVEKDKSTKTSGNEATLTPKTQEILFATCDCIVCAPHLNNKKEKEEYT